MKFFFDRQISIHIARMIDHFERRHTVAHQDDDGRFQETDDDVFLIQTIAHESPTPVWVTADLAQKRRPHERVALRDSGMSVVFFKRFYKGKSFHDQAMKVLAVWPNIVALCEKVRSPTAFEVPSGSPTSPKVDRLGPTGQILR